MTGPTTPDPTGPPPPPTGPAVPRLTQPVDPRIPDPMPGEPRPPTFGPYRLHHSTYTSVLTRHEHIVDSTVLGLYGWSVVWREDGSLCQRIHPDRESAGRHLLAMRGWA